MSAPLSQRLFGISFGRGPIEHVGALVEELRRAHPEGVGRVIVAQVDDSVADAQTLFQRLDLHHLPVVRGSHVVGMVSATDLLKFFSSTPLLDPQEIPLSEIMTPEPQVIRKDAPMRELIHTLAHARFRSLPVVNEHGEIWDIVTTRDLVKYLDLFGVR